MLAQGHTASQQHHLGLPDMMPSILGVGFSLCFALGMVKFDGQCVMRDPAAEGQRWWKSESAGPGGLFASSA